SGTSSTAATTRRSAASWVDRRVRDQASGAENRAWETAGGPGLWGLQLARLANERVSEGGEGLPALRNRDRRKPGGWPAPRGAKPADGVWGYRAVRSPRSGRALTEPARRRPPQQRGEAERESAHAGRRVGGHRSSAAPEGREQRREAERESAHTGRRGLGASEQRSARSARAADGPPGDKVTKILLVCRRELASMCGGPLAWILAAVFLLLTGYFFYSDLALFVLVGGANQTRGLWRFVFLDFRLVALLVVPLLTMRLFAEERKQGTLELLWTFPVRDGEVLAGKVLAALALYLGMLAATVTGPASMA